MLRLISRRIYRAPFNVTGQPSRSLVTIYIRAAINLQTTVTASGSLQDRPSQPVQTDITETAIDLPNAEQLPRARTEFFDKLPVQ